MKLSARFSEYRDALKQSAILLKPRQQEGIILIGSESSRFSRGTVEQQTQVEDGTYSCSVLSSPDEIRSLKPFLRRSITQNDILFDPEFFLSSVSRGWEPGVVAVRNQTELAGVVYAKEKIILGYHLGVVYADLSWGSVSFGDSAHQENTFRIAMEKLLASPGTRGIRLRILRGSPESAAIRKLIASRNLDAHFSRVKDHASLALPDTYEQLLHSFGSTTRHNFRYYRRRFEAAGHIYLEGLSLDELRPAAMYLKPRCSIPSQSGAVERLLDMVATADQVLAVGLKHRNGEWLGIIGGVYRPGTGVLLLQLSNDRNFPRDSLSVVPFGNPHGTGSGPWVRRGSDTTASQGERMHEPGC